MQTPTPDVPRLGTGGDNADTVLMNTRMINRVARSTAPPPVSPIYQPRPYPPAATPPAARQVTPAAPATPAGHDDTDDDDESPKFALTSTQVIASMAAAVAAAFIGAQLGVAGTIVGAAIASVVSVVGSSVIGHSLLLTRRKVRQTVQHVRGTGPINEQDAQTALLTGVINQDLRQLGRGVPAGAPATTRSATGSAAAGPGSKRRKWAGWWARPGRIRWVLVGLGASVAVFVGALGAVTAAEAVKGGPISGGSSGFSVWGGDRGGSGDDAPTTTEPTGPTSTGTAPTTESPESTTSTRSTTAPATSSAQPSSGSSAPATTAPSTAAPSTAAPSTAARSTAAPSAAAPSAASAGAATGASGTGG